MKNQTNQKTLTMQPHFTGDEVAPPEHDPNTFPIPRRVFEMNLSDNEFRVYAHIACLASRKTATQFIIARMAQMCRLSTHEVLEAATGLAKIGLIIIHHPQDQSQSFAI